MKRISDELIHKLTDHWQGAPSRIDALRVVDVKLKLFQIIAQAQLESCEKEHEKVVGEIFETIDKTGLIQEHTDSPLHETGATILECAACCWYVLKQKYLEVE